MAAPPAPANRHRKRILGKTIATPGKRRSAGTPQPVSRQPDDQAPAHPTVPILFCNHSENAAHSQRSIVPARQHR